MTLEKLSEGLTNIVKKITFASYIDEKTLRGVLKEIQKVLISADVNVKLVLELSKNIEKRVKEEKPLPGLSKREQIIRILYEELVLILGDQSFSLPRKARIMLVGLQGSGKTTSVAKLASFYSKKGLRTMVIGADTHRPGAYEQLKQLSEKSNFAFYGERNAGNAVSIVKNALKKAGDKHDILILDTAGRHASEKELFEEMKKLEKVFSPDEKLLVIDATLGQAAKAQAKAFDEAIGITGVVLTKLDTSAKGGGALSAIAETGVKIKFITTGEKLNDIEIFEPKRFISKLLGMGDLETLLEKASESVSYEDAEKIFKKSKLTLNDLREQIKSMQRLGSLANVLKMIPGLSMFVDKSLAELTEVKMKKFIYIIDSMTEEERENPEIINRSRIRRIAIGSGTSKEEVRELLNYFKSMNKMLKKIKKGRRGLPIKGLEKLGFGF